MNINLKRMPTSEIVFSMLYLGLEKDLAYYYITKRLKSFGYNLSEEKIIDLLTREIIKIKERGENLEDYCFRKNRPVNELIISGLKPARKTNNFENLTISEVVVLQDIFRRLSNSYKKYIEQIIKTGNNTEMSYIFPISYSNYNLLRLVYNILLEISNNQYELKDKNILSSSILGLKEASLFELEASSEYKQSMNHYYPLTQEQVLQDESLLETYCPKLK